MRYLFLTIGLIVCVTLPASAQEAPGLTIDLSADHVDITTGFNGARVVLYGVKNDPAAAVVAVLEGPPRTMVVRRKSKVLGAYINNNSADFHRVPGYYDYALSGALSDDAGQAFLAQNHIGLDGLDFYPEDEMEAGELRRFREALIRNKQTQGLYPLKPHTLDLINAKFFKAAFDLPASMPTGLYTVTAYLVEGNNITGSARLPLQVGQVGFSARINQFATTHGLAYGVLAVMLALFAGWGAYAFLRRD